MTTDVLCAFFHAKYDLVWLSRNRLVEYFSSVPLIGFIPSSECDGNRQEDKYDSLDCMDLQVWATVPSHLQSTW
jgi:hypothetical protein